LVSDSPEWEARIFLELNNFGKSEIFQEAWLRSSLISELPWWHILRERVLCIFYIDDERSNGNETIFGNFEEGGEKGPDILYIYKQPDDKVNAKAKRPFMRHAIYHEIGHSVYIRLKDKARKEWESLFDPTKPDLQVRSKNSSPEEDFTESYAYYIQDPDFLKDVNQTKYDFLKLHVFGSREYPEYKFPSS
jgi:hypothetical protein